MGPAWAGVEHWIASLGVGLLIGVVSERREAQQHSMAGVRTHALCALLGCASWTLGVGPFMVALLLVGALVVSAYWHSAAHDPGLTSEIALLFSLVLGGLAHLHVDLAVALGVLCALLLHAKNVLRRWSRELLREHELRDGLLLAAAALVVMPLLPQTPVDPWGVLRPATLWRVVVLVMAVGMLGHVLTRALGVRWGLPVTGFFSGFVSSTAAVASLGQRAKAGEPLAAATVSAILAQLASFLLFATILGTASMPLLLSMAWPLAAGALGLVLAAAALWRGGDGAAQPQQPQAQRDPARAFQLSQALLVAAIMAVVVLLAAWLQHRFGNTGVWVAAMLVALAEVHAAAASIAQLHASGSLDLPTAQWGAVMVLAASAVAKLVLALAVGGWRFGMGVGLAMVLMLAGTALGLWWAG